MEIKLSPCHEYLLIEYAFYEHIHLKLIKMNIFAVYFSTILSFTFVLHKFTNFVVFLLIQASDYTICIPKNKLYILQHLKSNYCRRFTVLELKLSRNVTKHLLSFGESHILVIIKRS